MSLGTTLFKAQCNTALLEACPICSGLPESSVLSISGMAREKTFEKGEFLMEEGVPATGFFLVLSGKVRVYKSSPSGKEKVLLIAEKSMTFGEDALFGDGVFLETAVALSRSRVLHIPRAPFLDLLSKNPQLAFQVMESLCLWIRRLGSSVENIAFNSARVRVATYLQQLATKFKIDTFVLPAKKKEIADQLGLAPETFSRTMQDFSQEKIIEVERKMVKILSFHRLQDVHNETTS